RGMFARHGGAPGGDGRLAAGGVAAFAILALLAGAFAGLVSEVAGDWRQAAGAFDATMLRVARFTLWQAALSPLLSVAPALYLARALSRHPDFPGRGVLLGLFAVPLGLPAIVVALGILSLYGRAGFVAELAAAAGWTWPGTYG